MAALENVYHNFPLLVKQSGFNFQSHEGRVNWTDIENLDINEITEGRNFELLEQNLYDVIICNLERECDFKILDHNFVKLFKLAQLGLEYLSYCKMYLDRCVVLLQEQLMASQDECELLKKKLQKRKDEIMNKNKNKNLKFQCEKCLKVFISDVYLKFHEKRRHNGTNATEISDLSPRTSSCNCQKTEEPAKLLSTQTLFLDEKTTVLQENENANDIKTNYLSKVEKLEQELEELKERIKKAESAVLEKTETPKLNTFHSINVPNSMHYNPTLMFLPSYLTHLGNSYCEINTSSQIPVPDAQPVSTLPYSENLETDNSKPSVDNVLEFKSSVLVEKRCDEPVQEKAESNCPRVLAEKKCEEPLHEKTELNIPNALVNKPQKLEDTEGLECEKENTDPNARIIKNIIKPLPPPRKSKKGIAEKQVTDNKTIPKVEAKALEKPQNTIVKSTPVKENQERETHTEIFECSIENISEINNTKGNSTESLHLQKSLPFGSESSKSFIKKLITKDTSSIQKLGKRFKRSLNSLHDSVSPTEKEVNKTEINFQNIRATVVDGLNNQLQQLGICSEWSGIPKKTMREKLSAWKHQRRLLCKDSLYPVARQSIEKKILQKLKKNFKGKKFMSSKEKLENTTGPEVENSIPENDAEFVKSRKSVMYDSATDSESSVSDSLIFDEKQPKDSQKHVIVEEITSSEDINVKKPEPFIFQQQDSLKKTDLKGFLDSDTSFSDNSDRKSLKKYTGGTNSVKDNNENEKPQFKVSPTGKTEMESQRFLKEFYSKPVADTHKKVLFAMHSKTLEEDLSDDSTDDDLWSLKSDWERNPGFTNRGYK